MDQCFIIAHLVSSFLIYYRFSLRWHIKELQGSSQRANKESYVCYASVKLDSSHLSIQVTPPRATGKQSPIPSPRSAKTLAHKIHDATKRGSIEDVGKLLREYPELINDKGEDGWNPIFRASYNNRLDLVEYLVENGASLGRDADEWQNTPLHACAINGHTKVGKYLISQGADVNESDNAGSWTPLYAASYFGNLEMVRLLLGAGADPTIKDNEGKQALDVVCDAGYRTEHRTSIQALLQDRPIPTNASRLDTKRHSRLASLSNLGAPLVPCNFSTPPPYTEDQNGQRVYFPWELTNADYVRRSQDILQEMLLEVFKGASEGGYATKLPLPTARFKPSLDVYNLLELAYERDEAIKAYLTKLAKGHQSTISVLKKIESVGTALRRGASSGLEDFELLLNEIKALATYLHLDHALEDLAHLSERFHTHLESKCLRLRYLRVSQITGTLDDNTPPVLPQGDETTFEGGVSNHVGAKTAALISSAADPKTIFTFANVRDALASHDAAEKEAELVAEGEEGEDKGMDALRRRESDDGGSYEKFS